jgi:uncharacterized protein with ATP-grasp and redox domains
MKKNILSLISGSMILLLLNSCCRTVDCEPWRATEIRTINFTAEEVTNLYVKKYEKNSNFTKVVDSSVFSNILNFSINTTGTNTFTLSLKDMYRIEIGYDYEIYFPNGNTTKRITDIRDMQSSKKFCNTGFAKKECFNDISSLKVDGITYSSFFLQK